MRESRPRAATGPGIGGGPAGLFAGIHLVGQALGTYIVAQEGGDILLVDQHAACERVLYESFRKALEEKSLAVQELLVPVTVEMSYREAAALRENLSVMLALGFVIEEFGANSFLVRGVPPFLAGTEARQVIQDIGEALAAGGRAGRTSGGREGEVIMAACKAAAKANDYLARGEMEKLLADLARVPNPYTCPHGRPTMLRISSRELAHRFKRS